MSFKYRMVHTLACKSNKSRQDKAKSIKSLNIPKPWIDIKLFNDEGLIHNGVMCTLDRRFFNKKNCTTYSHIPNIII